MVSPALPDHDSSKMTAAPATPRTILVVEDDPDVREVLVMALQDAGYRADSAPDGQAALRSLQSHRPDAIILDLMLPFVDGRAFMTACRADPATRDIPIIILSAAYGAASDPELGSLVFMAKPFDVEMLLILLQDALDE
jgi:CheY-like chemotaxis protein